MNILRDLAQPMLCWNILSILMFSPSLWQLPLNFEFQQFYFTYVIKNQTHFSLLTKLIK